MTNASTEDAMTRIILFSIDSCLSICRNARFLFTVVNRNHDNRQIDVSRGSFRSPPSVGSRLPLRLKARITRLDKVIK